MIAETVPGTDVDERVDVRIVRSAHADDGVSRTDARGRAEGDSGLRGAPSTDRAAFPGARLGTPALLRHAARAGRLADTQWEAGGRSFVSLRNGPARDGRRVVHRREIRGVRGEHS